MTGRFSWDKVKNRKNVKKHGVSLQEGSTIFKDPSVLTIYDIKHSTEQEERWVSIGLSNAGKILVVSHTYSIIEKEENIRLISTRKANSQESETYYARRR